MLAAEAAGESLLAWWWPGIMAVAASHIGFLKLSLNHQLGLARRPAMPTNWSEQEIIEQRVKESTLLPAVTRFTFHPAARD